MRDKTKKIEEIEQTNLQRFCSEVLCCLISKGSRMRISRCQYLERRGKEPEELTTSEKIIKLIFLDWLKCQLRW
jgi:hypothetical protein